MLNLIKNDLTSLANLLYSHVIITESVKDQACNENQGKDERGVALLNGIESRIKGMSSEFRKLIEILKSKPFFATLGNDLVQAYCK